MRKIDATEYKELYASFMKLKKNKREKECVWSVREKDEDRKNTR